MAFKDIIASLKRSFRIGEKFSSQELNQTDFGRIYFNLPEAVVYPKTTEALAQTLRQYHQQGKAVSIRNTGHSVNGQTLTSGVQVNIGGIQHAKVNWEKLEVTVGAGTSWHDILRAIKFPRYCLPIFPNNPGQQIKIGGTASVGGVGFYSARVGGLWNHVSRLTLVTMTGQVIQCSPKQHANFFYYALGGFGRIGVISELTIRIVPSTSRVLAVGLVYHDRSQYMEDLMLAAKDPQLHGVMTGEYMAERTLFKKMHLHLYTIVALIEYSSSVTIAETFEALKHRYHHDMTVSFYEREAKHHRMDVDWRVHKATKADIVYWYPESVNLTDELALAHPWADFILPEETYNDFMIAAREVVYKYGMEKYLVRQSVFDKQLHPCVFPSYILKNMGKPGQTTFPLALDLSEKSYGFMPGVQPNLPFSQVKQSLVMVDELTELGYSLGGKRYLYGIHNLKKKHVVKQFGKDVLNEWQCIKDELDPKHLLNRGVIEHLD
jgi:cytokinin dehydrogenase